MSTQKTSYAVILNFETGKVDILSLHDMNPSDDAHEFIEEMLDYSLTNCEWMTTTTPYPNPINF
jgi:hypothetical protein